VLDTACEVSYTKGMTKIPAHYTIDQLRTMRQNAHLGVLDARARRNRQAEMKMQAAITLLDARIDELSN